MTDVIDGPAPGGVTLKTDESVGKILDDERIPDDTGIVVAPTPTPTPSPEVTKDAVITEIVENVRKDIDDEIELMRVEERMKRAVEELVRQGANIEAIKAEIIERINAGVETIELVARRLDEQLAAVKDAAETIEDATGEPGEGENIEPEIIAPVEKSTRRCRMV
jgi:hypothetical protein